MTAQAQAKVTVETLAARVEEQEVALKAMATLIEAMGKEILALKDSKKGPKSEQDMTDDMAKRMLNGDLKDKSHKEVADALKLSYGQVYSCRLQFTFKHIHKELRDAGFKNPWVK